MSGQKRWQPWVLYRRVNRTFKQIIEEYYIEEWLEWSSIWVDCDDSLPVGDYHLGLSREYSFEGFAVSTERLAVYGSSWKGAGSGRDRLDVCLFILCTVVDTEWAR
jgi:hypothetical protein